MKAFYRNPSPPPIQWINDGFFDYWATKLNPLWTLRRPLARVIARQPASSDAVTLRLRPNRHFGGLLPGQHVTLGAEINGRLTTRSYSPTRLVNGELEVTVKRVDGGQLSNLLADRVAVGAVLDIGAAFGQMTLDPGKPQPLLLLAAGSGITPMRALLAQWDAAGFPAPVTLVYWARHREQLCFAGELAALAARRPGFTLELAVTGEGAGRVDVHPLPVAAPLAQTRVLACGPGAFVEAARARLAGQVAGFEAEAFSLPPLPAVEEGSVQVELSRSGRTLSVPRGVPLLQALEQAGLAPASGCRMGLCNTCTCGKTSGVSRHVQTGERNAEPSTPLKLCVNSASSDLVLEL